MRLLRRGGERFVSTTAGVVSRHAFSFGEHYDPNDVGHGALLVCNEDLLQAGHGYDEHPHADAEIVTWVLSGTLHHRDSSGHAGLVYRGVAQRMSAGSGIVHSERNDGYRLDPSTPTEPVRFVQMWLRPDVPGGTPSCAHHEIDASELGRHWVPVVSGGHPDAPVRLASAGSTLWVSVLGADTRRVLPEAAYVFVLLARGEVRCEGFGRLKAGDSLRLTGGGQAVRGVAGESELLVWALAV